jgi:hypothetical protein
MAYEGFKKLKAMIGKKGGASDPAAIAAGIMRKKYKQSDIVKHQQSGTSMKNVSPKKK